MSRALSVFLVLFICQILQSAQDDSLKLLKVGVLPLAYFTPETRIGVGGLLYSFFRVNKMDTASRKSNTQTYVSFTMNKQYAVEHDYQVWLRANRIYLTGSADWKYFPEFFYGIGNNTKESDRVLVSYNLINLKAKNLVRIRENMYGGIILRYNQLYNQDMQLVSNSPCMEVYGNMGFTSKGIGPIFIIDKRDNPLNPENGSYFEASYMDYKNVLANDLKFSSIQLDARKYFTFKNKVVWNGDIYFSFNNGTVPYKMMPEIGGARFLRGYYRGRFRDNNMAVIQQEFRVPIYKIIGVAVFGGIGSVAKTLSYFQTNEIHYNYGFGLRFKVNKKENTNIRVDFGFTRDSQGLYVVFAEAF